MKKTTRFILAGVLCLSIGTTQSQESFSLEEAKAYTLENNFSVKNAALEVENAGNKVIETRGTGLPQVNLEGNFTHFINIPVQVVDAGFINPNAPPGSTISFRAGTDYSSSASLKASQMLFNGSYIIALKVSQFYVDLQKTYALQTQEEALFSVVQAYEMAAVAKSNLIFIDSMVVTSEELVEKQRNYLELGLIQQEDIDQLEYSAMTAKNARLNAELQYKNALTMLKLAMNYPVANPIEISDDVNSLLLKTSSLNSEKDYKANLNYSLMDMQVQVSRYTLQNVKSANLPSLNAFFQHTYNAYRNEFNFFDSNEKWYPQTFYGVTLNIPVFSGLQRHSQIEQSKVKLLQAENDLKYYEQNLIAQEIQLQNNLIAAQQRVELQEANLKLARRIYDNALIREEIGNGNSILVTQKYNQLMMAQSEYVSATLDIFNAQLNLDRLYNNILQSNL